MLSKSLAKVYFGGGGGGLFYCTAKTASLMKEVLFSWDIRENYATKSTLTECVKRFCLGCILELLAAFLEFPKVVNLTEGGGGGGGLWGAIDSTRARYLAHE